MPGHLAADGASVAQDRVDLGAATFDYYAQLLRIGDGPDEVHYRQIFKMEPPAPWSVDESPYVMARPA